MLISRSKETVPSTSRCSFLCLGLRCTKAAVIIPDLVRNNTTVGIRNLLLISLVIWAYVPRGYELPF